MLKKWISLLCTAAAALTVFVPYAFADSLPQPPCEAYIVMDADTGQVIMEYNADDIKYPASTTKIMTLGLALEKAEGALDTTLTVSHDAVHQLEQGSSHIALQEGELVRLEDILYGTQMDSANDGANVLAEYVGGDGTIQSGVDAMNRKAAELGLTQTHFVNPHGLFDENHYTTARELAEITRWALSIPGFETVFCRTEPWPMAPTNKQPQQRVFHNVDKMRIGGEYFRSYARGAKTGFHNQALHTFVNYAVQGDMRLISVEMGCPTKNSKFTAAAMILDYAFGNYQRVTVPAPTDSYQVELVGGGGRLGNVTVRATDSQFLLHNTLSSADVMAEYSIPEQYVLGQPFSAMVQYTLKENPYQPTRLGGGELEVIGLPEILKANTFVPQNSLRPGKNPLGVILGVGAAVVAVILTMRLMGRGRKSHSSRRRHRASQAEWEFISRQPLDGAGHQLNERDREGRPHTRRR